MTGAGVLAHQGGWDEILLVLTPVAMFAGLLWLANRRANDRLAERAGEDHGDGAAADDEDDDRTGEERAGPSPSQGDAPGAPPS